MKKTLREALGALIGGTLAFIIWAIVWDYFHPRDFIVFPPWLHNLFMGK